MYVYSTDIYVYIYAWSYVLVCIDTHGEKCTSATCAYRVFLDTLHVYLYYIYYLCNYLII